MCENCVSDCNNNFFRLLVNYGCFQMLFEAVDGVIIVLNIHISKGDVYEKLNVNFNYNVNWL